MKLFRKTGHVCKNCYFAKIQEGKYVKPLFKKKTDFLWYIYCERKHKFFYGHASKRCFIGKAHVYKSDYYRAMRKFSLKLTKKALRRQFTRKERNAQEKEIFRTLSELERERMLNENNVRKQDNWPEQRNKCEVFFITSSTCKIFNKPFISNIASLKEADRQRVYQQIENYIREKEVKN